MLNASRLCFLAILIVTVVPLKVYGDDSLARNTVQVKECNSPPVCKEPPACKKQVIAEKHDARNCKNRVDLPCPTWEKPFKFCSKYLNDPACEAAKASQNALYAKTRASGEAKYRQCLENNKSITLKCEIAYTDWEICISENIQGFPPQDFRDRKLLYYRCLNLGGEDEFTDVCCSHFYNIDKVRFEICAD